MTSSLSVFRMIYRMIGFQKIFIFSQLMHFLNFSPCLKRLQQTTSKRIRAIISTKPVLNMIIDGPIIGRKPPLPRRSSFTSSSKMPFWRSFIPKKVEIVSPMLRSSRNSPRDNDRSLKRMNRVNAANLSLQMAIYVRNCTVRMRFHKENSTL